MNIRKHILLSAALTVALATVSCGDAATTDSGSMESTRQAATVVPEFNIEGTEQLPSQFRLTDLGLVISEIRLEPVGDSDSGLAYSNRDPIVMSFDVQGGETSKVGTSFVLPEAGTYDVSLRLEPTLQRYEQSREAGHDYSFNLTGYIRGDAIVRVDPEAQNPNADGDPVPLPFDPKETDSDGELHDRTAPPKQWTRFQYQSSDSLVYTLDEVQFGEGRQYLSFVFEVEDWAEELIKPVAKVVRDKSSNLPGSLGDRGRRAVDVTKAVDSLGEGPASLGDHMRVRTLSASAHARSGGAHGGNGL